MTNLAVCCSWKQGISDLNQNNGRSHLPNTKYTSVTKVLYLQNLNGMSIYKNYYIFLSMLALLSRSVRNVFT